ncbi:Uncharacterised protein [Mycobacteroides abscessus subsp. abscessus]|nr:Uncharacterised protein [Mycobacteroides abscessus subsp. abscessus]SKV16029.1 Uncharacterised protein [Mycobacteroides abscessus subsp. abscessus]
MRLIISVPTLPVATWNTLITLMPCSPPDRTESPIYAGR